MASSFLPLLILCFFFFIVNQVVVLAGIILEEGYTVSTILSGYKLEVSPFFILPQYGSSDLILLDNSDGTFYTLSFSSPKEGLIKKLAGSGEEGYEDGELGLARFNKVTNFAVDFRGNIYVADVHDCTIRKISKTGVTTIAGGYSRKPGNKDGPAQNATFSHDFRLTFVPERCALMISDRGNKLIRQINLKAEDCAHNSHSGLGMSSAWAVVLGLSCLLLGLVIGFVSRPYITSRTGRNDPTAVQRDMETLPNESGQTSIDALLRHQKRSC